MRTPFSLWALALITAVSGAVGSRAAATGPGGPELDPASSDAEQGTGGAPASESSSAREGSSPAVMASLAAPAEMASVGVRGLVKAPQSPVGAARIYAYEVTSSSMKEARSDEDGRFSFDDLPAGMYRLIAFKPGFLPAVELLLRKRPSDRQIIELRLEPAADDRAPADQAYWSVRGKVPADVLRQMQHVHASEQASRGVEIAGAGLFRADVRAFSGVESFGGPYGDAMHTTAELQLEGAIG
ncbi:MAG: carboxypeptidase regulatory-like domain-containing protein, partial [Holophagales bacterium]|nr:carboxypeptidase regulatory-like domain-containing protein [Holophagales bacterium]